MSTKRHSCGHPFDAADEYAVSSPLRVPCASCRAGERAAYEAAVLARPVRSLEGEALRVHRPLTAAEQRRSDATSGGADWDEDGRSFAGG